MKSMTGYAYREFQDENLALSVEIKGYNSRFLELTVNLPLWLSGLEWRIKEHLQSRFGRGKIEVFIKVKENNTELRVAVNTGAAKAYEKAVKELAETLGSGEKPSLSLILGMEGVLETERNRDDERYWLLLEPLLKKASDDFDAQRSREGKHTEADILSYIGALEKNTQIVAAHAPLHEKLIRENIRSRFAEVLEDRFEIDESRILAETAVLLMKYTIAEELNRLSAHFEDFRAEIAKNPGPARKLDFLCQEINREINTIGSKTPVLEVSRAVVEMKDALENIREQLRNVE